MFFKKILSCPGCKRPAEVYLAEKEMPPMGEPYGYRCENCQREVVFRAGGLVVVKAIPDGATLAHSQVAARR